VEVSEGEEERCGEYKYSTDGIQCVYDPFGTVGKCSKSCVDSNYTADENSDWICEFDGCGSIKISFGENEADCKNYGCVYEFEKNQIRCSDDCDMYNHRISRDGICEFSECNSIEIILGENETECYKYSCVYDFINFPNTCVKSCGEYMELREGSNDGICSFVGCSNVKGANRISSCNGFIEKEMCMIIGFFFFVYFLYNLCLLGGRCNDVVNCEELVEESCISSPYCVFISSNSARINGEDDGDENGKNKDGKCVLDECAVLSFEECSRNKSCGIIEGVCKLVKNGSVNGTISGPVIGG
jgi:hypothetical protein